MTAHSLGQLAHVGGLDSREQMEDARDSLVATLAWMTAAIASRSAAPAALPELSSSRPMIGAAESWRTSAGGLTPERVGGGESADHPSIPSRVVAEVDSEALGPIRLVVERTKSGVSVVVAVRGDTSLSEAQAHRAGIEQALAAAGLSVASVQFARVNEDGITFAHGGDEGSSDALGGEGGDRGSGESRARASGKRRLNTFG